ncbi:MAG: hypothetical protein JO360_06295 [Acidobacteria bacterium]|nr:hypothetical protein [Acidobacteriota bacterium]
MHQLEHFTEIIAAYSRHGWELRRVLMCAETRLALASSGSELCEGLAPEESKVDALWFARASHAGREAWELRLVGETPYALFETFEADEDEEEREDVRREMLARLEEYAARS